MSKNRSRRGDVRRKLKNWREKTMIEREETESEREEGT